jgi:hypothetical protein
LNAQTGIGTTTPHASAKLEVASDRQGFLPPRMTSSQRTSIQNPATGLMVYQTDGTAGLYYHYGTTWIYIINSTTDVLPVANGGTGLSALGNGVATFIGTPTSANLASAITNETGSGALVFGTSPTISLPTITSGSDQFPQSIFISPSTHATSKRAAIWLDGWSILQDVLGNGTKNFSIGETISGPQYPTRFVISQGNGNIGLGTNTPTARLNLEGGGIRIATGFNNSGTRPALNTATIGAYEIRGVGSGGSGTSQNDGADDGFLRLSAGGGTASNAQSSIDISGFSTQGDMNNNIVMRTLGTERLRITSEGRVGIGTNSPAAPLHVASFVNQSSVSTYGSLTFSGAFGNQATSNHAYSILADQFIRASQFHAISDVRIKKNINQLNTQKQLSELNKLQVVNYSYIDQLANGNKIKTGFIAQEVEAVNNQFVNQSADFIPSIYAIANTAVVNNKILQITINKSHDLIKGDQVKFFIEGNKEVIKRVDKVLDAYTFTVGDWQEATKNLFVYGKKVSDFRAIDFDQITALSVAAIQELSKQIDSLKKENVELRKSINQKFEFKQLELEKRILKLEARHKN